LEATLGPRPVTTSERRSLKPAEEPRQPAWEPREPAAARTGCWDLHRHGPPVYEDR
jgi:hypothetical protein